MSRIARVYDSMLREHLETHRQMAFVSGPRQVGKTTCCQKQADFTLTWDNPEDRAVILGPTSGFDEKWGLNRLREKPPVVLLDELHKYPRWKQFLKGVFDTRGERLRILVTGSSRLETYKRVGDSLMGRYFSYRMHPFSLAETLHRGLPNPGKIFRAPEKPDTREFDALWEHGGFPEPFLRRDPRFTLRWQDLRATQLIREDVRDLTQIQQLDQLALLANLLADRSGMQLVYSNLADTIRVSVDTVRRWIEALASLHHGFLIRPWFKNVTRSLRKEPKWYLRDWSGIADPGQRSETLVACHLLKAVEGWNDLGLGRFQLGYLRDKEQREVDFVVIKDGKPWFLAEVKHGDGPISPSLAIFQKQTGAPFAFQVVLTGGYVQADCFRRPGPPVAVPARTFLSQLL